MNDLNSKPAQLVRCVSVADLIETYGEPTPEALEADRANLEAIVQWLVEDGLQSESELGGVFEP